MALSTNPAIQESVDELNHSIEIDLMQVLAKCYGEGFVKAAESLEARPHVTRDDSDLLRQDTEQLVRPIRDYNQALADKIYQIVDEGFASGKNDLQVAKDLRSKVRDILNNEPITIQRPGKRPVSFTAAGYADLIADVIPYSIRNGGYLRGLEESGADGWEWIAAEDERTCPACGALHGRIFGWDDPAPPLHPRCRCRPVAFFRPKTAEEEAESERVEKKASEKPLEAEEGQPKTGESVRPEDVADSLLEPILPKNYVYPGSKIERPKIETRPIDLATSPTYQRLKATDPSMLSFNNEGLGGLEDTLLRDFAEEVGFADPGVVVPGKELTKIIEKGGHKELYRGLTESVYVDQFKTGPYFAGSGVYGNGTYTAYGRNSVAIAYSYSSQMDDTVLRMALDKDAKVVDFKTLWASMEEELSRLGPNNDLDKELLTDPGRYALLKGYDAIDVPESEFMVVLNRKALYIQEEPISVEELRSIMDINHREAEVERLEKRTCGGNS